MNKFTIIRHNKQGVKQYTLNDSKTKVAVFFGLSVAVGGIFALGLLIGSLLNDDDAHQLKINRLRATVAENQTKLQDYQQSVQQDLDAMSLQVGRLMAQSTRLNALGERLTLANNIDPTEFNLSQNPGVGSAELQLSGEQNNPKELYKSLFDLESDLSQQQERFNILAQLLDEEQIDHRTTPHHKPLKSGWISSHFGHRTDPFTGKRAMHSGIDFSGKYRAEIQAAADGIVTWSGRRGNYGLMIEIDHGNGYTTRYAHAKELKAKVGQRVRSGDSIAIMGKSGRATSEHLHFEVLKDGHKVNPWPFLQS